MEARRCLIERLLDEREESGETYRKLAERSGIPAPTLAWWQNRLRDGRGRRDRVELIELASAMTSPLSARSSVEIVLPSNITVRVPLAAGVEVLGQIFDPVSERC
jgi:transcriptional regulator with XRE-family HTH domain